jgi:hypothetical protein
MRHVLFPSLLWCTMAFAFNRLVSMSINVAQENLYPSFTSKSLATCSEHLLLLKDNNLHQASEVMNHIVLCCGSHKFVHVMHPNRQTLKLITNVCGMLVHFQTAGV